MKSHVAALILAGLGAAGITVGFYFPYANPTYSSDVQVASTTVTVPEPFKVTHIKTPQPVKAIYMSSWVGGNEELRSRLVTMIDATEINTVVLDVKDYTGRISFMVSDPELQLVGSSEKRIPDIKEFIAQLHEKGIYVIGRISSFQDSYLVRVHPEYAVKTKSTGAVWQDRKGVKWLDVGARPVWEYLAKIGDEAYSAGFDELNFDYIRFPSDGNMIDIAYPFSQGKIRQNALAEFFAFIGDYFHAKQIPISADLFGLTTSNHDDLGIGQVIENALAHFDYVAPMVYPSHYPDTFNGWAKPAEHPYDLIRYVMQKGIERASSTPSQLRPWLQDFSINGTHYTPEMVRAQIQATYDVGLDSWMLWNASNVYTASALEPVRK